MAELGQPVNETTTEELERLLIELPAVFKGKGLHVSSLPMAITRMPDMYFSFPDVSPAEMAELIVSAGGALVFMKQVDFDPLSLVDEETGLPDDAPEVDRVLSSAMGRQGELSGILLTCPVQGMLWRWQASAGWSDELQQQLDTAIEATEEEQDQANSALFQSRRAKVQELIAQIMEDPSYRGTPPHKRSAAAKRMAPTPTSDEDSFLITSALEGIGRRDREAADLRNLEIQERLPELAAALVQTPEWINSHTVTARKRIAGNFLAAQFEGWAVHAQVADELRAHAATLG